MRLCPPLRELGAASEWDPTKDCFQLSQGQGAKRGAFIQIFPELLLEDAADFEEAEMDAIESFKGSVDELIETGEMQATLRDSKPSDCLHDNCQATLRDGHTFGAILCMLRTSDITAGKAPKS